jgi:hypothetical protein
MDGVCSTNDRDYQNINFSSEYLNRRGFVEAVDVDGRVILTWALKKCGGGPWSGFV